MSNVRLRFVVPALGLLLAAGCTSVQRAELPADERFGHRYDDDRAAGRETVMITPPDTGAQFFYYPAPFDTVHVRSAPFREGIAPAFQELPVEVLVKGSFPDACTELHDIEQNRTAHIIEVQLRIRRPRGSVCAAVVRPYRFYFMLPGTYTPGHYTLKLNEEIVPFQIMAPES